MKRNLTLGGILSPGNRAALGALIAVLVASCAGGFPTGQSPFLALTAEESGGRVNVSPSTVDFGVIRVGANATQSVTLTNSGPGRATVDQVETTGSDFQISGLPLPLALEEGQSATFLVTFSPSIVGSVSGSISLSGSASDSPTLLALAGQGDSLEESGQLTIVPSTVDFGDVAVDDLVTREVALSNQGNASLTIFQADISSTNFLIGGLSLPLTLAAGQSTFFTVGFAPLLSGTEVASVSFVTDSSSAPNTLLLSGNGVRVPGTLSFIPGVVDFGDVTVGDSVSQGVVLSNSGSGTVNVSAVSVDGAGFSVGGLSLPVVLGAGASTTFSVNFSPSTAGSSTASVSVTSDASNSPTSLPLTGNGMSAVGTLVLTPASVDFGDVTVGASQARTITLSNSGSGTVTVSEAQAAGSAFSVSGITLPLVLVGGGSATFSVSFTPMAGGSVAGSVTLVSNASNAPNILSFTGNGLAAVGTLSLSPTTHNFGDVAVGTGATQAVTLMNSGEGGVTITQADFAGGTDFSLAALPLPFTLSSGQTTTFQVAFTPATVGALSATLSLVSDASNSPATLSVTGNGVSPAGSGQLAVNPLSLDFGTVPVGNSLTQTVALTNSGSAALTVSGAVVSGGGFSIDGLLLPLSLAAGETATFDVTFSPQSAGTVTDSLLLTSDASNSPVTMPLTGTGTVLTGALSLTPASLNFGDILVGAADTHVVTLSNTGSGAVTVSGMSVSGTDFSVTGISIPLTLEPGESSPFNVIFVPSSAGNLTGNVIFTSDATNSPTLLSLAGNGLAATGTLNLNPGSIDFGDVTAGTSQGQAVTLTNSGNGSLTISEISVIGTEFSVTGIVIPLTLGVGESATLSVAFAPPVDGSVTGSISLGSDAANSPTLISLTGNGVSSNGLLSLSPGSLDFGDVTVGSSATRSVTLTNSGSTVVLVSTFDVTGAEFSVAGLALPLNLSPGETATFSVTLTPAAAGSVSGNVSLASDASNSPTVVSLTGNGIDAGTAKVVDLFWDPSISVVDGYNVYRSTVLGGPYGKINSALVPQTTFVDDTVQAGKTYFYVVVAVDAGGVESQHSNEAQASIP